MDGQSGHFRFLRLGRAAGLLTIGLIASSGAPGPASADGECYYVIDCHHSAETCVEHSSEDCMSLQGCGDMIITCAPSSQYPDCPRHEFIELCKEVVPT